LPWKGEKKKEKEGGKGPSRQSKKKKKLLSLGERGPSACRRWRISVSKEVRVTRRVQGFLSTEGPELFEKSVKIFGGSKAT